jgi:thioredoxin reductase
MSNPAPHVLIVGGGAAGVTCALFLGRAGITSTVFDRMATTLKKAGLQNYPASKPILGLAWLRDATNQMKATGNTTVELKQVIDVEPTGSGFVAKTEGEEFSGDYVVLTSGQEKFDYANSLGVETTDALQPFVPTNVVVDRWGATSIPRVYACGLLAGWPSQTVIVAGSGATVAHRIISEVKGEWWVDHDTPADMPKSNPA